MCEDCFVVNELFEVACTDRHTKYIPTIQILMEMEKIGKIELYAADCEFSEATEVLDKEHHYTVCHYFKCKSCEQLFFIGACIRGTPIYRLIDDINSIDFSNMIWGNIGTRYISK